MAVQAHHMNIFSQFISPNRDCVKFQENMNHGEFEFTGGEVPLITGESFAVEPLAAKANFNKAESGLSYNFTVPPLSTKRQRDFQFSDSNAPVKRRSVAFDSSSPSLINVELVS